MSSCSVIWDWNGTIVDDADLFVDIMNGFLKEKKLPLIDKQKYREFFDFPIIDYYKKLGFSFEKESFESLGKRFIDVYKERRFESFLFDGVVDVFGFLKNHRVSQFVVSAQENGLLSGAVKYYNLSCFFKDFCGVENIFAKGKIEQGLFFKKKYLYNNNKLFVVGDSLYDFDLAKALGGIPVLVSYGHYNKQRLLKKNCVVVDSIDELELFFRREIKKVY